LIWSCEDEIDELLFRQDCINKRHRLTKADLGKLHVNPRIGLDSTLMENVNGKLVETPVLAELRKQLNATGAQVLVLDNVAHIYGGLDDRTQVTKFVRTVSSLVTDRPFATIFVTHVPKGQSSDYAGTIAWENAVRMRWLLEQGENDDLKKSIGKSNVAGLTFANLRIVDSVMVALNDRQIAEARQKEAEKQKARLESAEQVLVSGLEKIVKEKGKYPVYKRRSQESLVTLIISHDLAATASKQELEAAWDRIEREGRFVTSRPTDSLTGKPWVYSNGTPKFAIERIVPSGKGDPVDSMVTASEL
jgi:KaiC/GvpD/RAD55 family RecA-like ATPase